MSKRSENIAFKLMPNGNIRAYQADKSDKSGVSELQFTNPENVSPTVIIGNTIKVIEEYMCMKKPKKVTMAERLQTLIGKGKINKEGQCIDLYNVITHDNVFCSLTTRVDAGNYYVTQKSNKQDMAEQKKSKTYKNPGTIYLGRINTQKERHQQDRVFDYNGSSPTISAGETLGRYLTKVEVTTMADQQQIELPEELKGKKFRIRKLTPRECFRLMGVDDKYIDKIQAAGVSNSAQYKLAGNSIVAGGNYKDSNGNWDGVLFNLFRKMFIETGVDNNGEPQQLTLFF